MTEQKRHKNQQGTPGKDSTANEAKPAPEQRVASAIVLEQLKTIHIEWLSIQELSREADDTSMVEASSVFVQIAHAGRIDAYLICWREWPDQLKIETLCRDTSDRPALIKTLAGIWRELKEANQGAIVFTHLVTNDYPSPKPISPEAGKDGHLAKFIASQWQRGPSTDSKWSKIWSALKEATELPDDDF